MRRWWGPPEPGFPWSDDPDETRFTVELDGETIGMVQFYEELEPRYRYAAADLFLDAGRHGQGIGTEVMRMLCAYLFDERGHHRVTIDPAAANAAAIRAYEKAGFRTVGVMRRYERDVDGDQWHDALLMELVDERGADGAG